MIRITKDIESQPLIPREVTNDEIKEITKGITISANQDEIDRRQKEAVQLNLTRKPEALQVINNALRDDNIDSINIHDFHFTASTVGNIGLTESTLTKELFDAFFEEGIEGEYSHYMRFGHFESMISRKKLRLYSISKWFKDEFTQFYDDHKLEGYKKRTDALYGLPYYESLMSNLFALCLTDDINADTEKECWNSFAIGGLGVKVVFNVKPLRPYLRKIHYKQEKSKINSIFNLNKYFKEDSDFDRHFNFNGMSRFGAYYLNNKFSTENEWRFLVKHDCELEELDIEILEDAHTNGKKIQYIELDFTNLYAEFEIKAVQPGEQCNRNDVRDSLQKAGLGAVEVLANYEPDEGFDDEF